MERDDEDDPVSVIEYHMTEEEVANSALDYSDRAASDYVVTRPLGSLTESAARAFGHFKFGKRLRSVKAEPAGDVWIFVVRKA